MKPLPPEVGMIQMSITRHKSGFNRFWPKYVLNLSDGNKFLLNAKKQSGNRTSNYLVTMDVDQFKKGTKGHLGKLRSNFLGTEFYLYDEGENPDKAKRLKDCRM